MVFPLTRREMLVRSANGFGAAALAALLQSDARAEKDPFAPRSRTSRPRRRRSSSCTWTAGRRRSTPSTPSRCWTKYHGKPFTDRRSSRRSSTTSATTLAVAVEVPPVRPERACRSATCSRTSPSCVDDLCVIRSMVVELLRAHQRQLLPAHRQRPCRAGRAWAPGSPTAWAASATTCPASSSSTAA